MKRWLMLFTALLGALWLLAACAPLFANRAGVQWTDAERAAIESLWIGNLPALPADPSNRWADDDRAAALGKAIFFDPRFSANGQVSCASCHQPGSGFTDRLPRGQGIALSRRRTMTVAGAAYAPWLFWDGRKDSLWSQALEPMEDPAEHGFTRQGAAHLLADAYAQDYQAIFGPLPELADPARFPAEGLPGSAAWDGMAVEDQDAVNRVAANMGKALAAYQRRLIPAPSRFDHYVESILPLPPAEDRGEGLPESNEDILTPDEIAGLRLFIGEAECINCHNGPLFTNQSFHNTGVPRTEGEAPDRGRADAIQRVLADPFNCLGAYSDAGPDDCAELRFIQTSAQEFEGGFKPPTLRGAASAAPYMHNGVFATLEEVVQHYNRAALAEVGLSELRPLRLSARERAQLVAFLKTLDGGVIAP